MKIGMTFDLRSDYKFKNVPDDFLGEFDNIETIHFIQNALQKISSDVIQIGNINCLMKRLVCGERFDLVFNIAEGIWGRAREALVPALLEAYQIPYTFSDPVTLGNCLDKGIAKKILSFDNLPTAPFAIIRSIDDILIETKLFHDFPLFVKPIHEGASKGISYNSIVFSKEELKDTVESLLLLYKQPVIVEEYLPGEEFTVGIVGTGIDAEVIGITSITVLGGKKVYGYREKELCENLVQYKKVTNADIIHTISEIAILAYNLLECQDAGRVDIKLDKNGNPAILELNPLPGLHPTHSDLPIIAAQNNINYDDLIASILRSSFKRLNLL
jgi:D-alanine-D-alanine ligase